LHEYGTDHTAPADKTNVSHKICPALGMTIVIW
jgi:hypothetical protein